jgi:hypothetical protein
MGNPKTYQLGDRLTFQELEALGIERDSMGHLWGESRKDGRYARAVRTSEFRAPKKGEWYLSGAKPLAYRAPNDLGDSFRIMALVAVEKRTVVQERVGLPYRFEG